MNTYTGSKPKSFFSSNQDALRNGRATFTSYFTYIMLDKALLHCLIGLLLGRAVILSTLSPFAVAFITSVWFLRKDKVFPLILFTIIGASTHSFQQSVYVLLGISAFFCLAMLLHLTKNKERYLPVIGFLSGSLSRLAISAMTTELTYLEWVFAAVEGTLIALLILIFMQSVPLLSPKRYKPTLKNEEIVCFIILIASVMTGFIGWSIYDAQLEQMLSRYLVLVFALIGGAAIGSTVGVVAGLILSLAHIANLYQMSLLAFSGLLGGLMKEGNKWAVSLGLFVSTILISLYGSTGIDVVTSLMESSLAVGLFLLTPASFIRKIARYIPGTIEHSKEQEQYLQKVRNVTAHRVERFSNVFRALSRSFQSESNQIQNQDVEVDYYLSNVTEKTCQTCFLKESCWVKQFDKTYDLMTTVKDELETDNGIHKVTQRNFENHCVRSKKVIDTMQQELSFFQANQKLKKQVLESRKFVAEQLHGVSDVMENFAEEILKEKENHEQQEIEIVAALKHVGIELDKLDIYSLEEGNVDIEMVIAFQQYHGEAEKLIAPILSDILSETVVVVMEDLSPLAKGHSFFTFGSARKYEVTTGVAHAAKGGGLVSGDSYKAMELGAGKYALAISDGMGNGKRAHEESTETLRLLQQILESGMHEQVAIKSINSILSLRTNDEIYATLDLAMIDLHDASVRFLKIGSIPSYVMRGDAIERVEASNLPIGIIQEFEVEVVHEQFKSGDFVIMMSDGIFEGPKQIENVDLWLKRKLREMQTTDPQEMADLLLEEVIRTQSGDIDDDMTVLVAQIEKKQPEWAPIRAEDAGILSQPS
ncbi:stage II sporulation protein E [Gracilibacillus halophilus YIM-C55.5]|uniref:Stage II sporulation protein E n=1 Tax=Gracilibacillus halophilus YIM-C55.5 TaxID=1308866 RepID=N4WEG6_9BACI|nr:stage II sporulation protein E [Gracilibacillus halophilus]ENH97634.1 stage II sporulation protein E [Gracilibacillus halophilus YIM-C55.5]